MKPIPPRQVDIYAMCGHKDDTPCPSKTKHVLCKHVRGMFIGEGYHMLCTRIDVFKKIIALEKQIREGEK